MIKIENIQQLENLISGVKSGNIETYSKKRQKRDDDIMIVESILKKCRSMIQDIDPLSDSLKEAQGWIHGALSATDKAKVEF